jgi:uncharacterized protein (DUF1501 family)
MNNSRRNFLRHSLAGVTAGTFCSALPSFYVNASDVTGYKALVCVFLLGGMDSHDTILPYDQSSYDQYSQIRSSLMNAYRGNPGGSSRERARLLPLTPENAMQFGERQFALPEEFAGIRALFNNGSAAIVGNVGPLVRPLTRDAWETGSMPAPTRLFSHNDQQSTWMALLPEGSSSGWGGHFADAALASSANTFPAFSNISTAGNSLFLTGRNTSPYPVTTEGGADFGILSQLQEGRFTEQGENLYQIMRQHLSSSNFDGNNLLARDIATANRRSLNDNEAYNLAFRSAPPLTTPFPGNNFLAQQLRNVAQSISLRDSLGMHRQVFFVTLGGFDTHSAQASALPRLQRQIDEAITAFYQSTVELGVESDVTLFTASDFGRTLTTNGDGTDHGWGGHHFVIGGNVNGNHIYGDIPPVAFGHNLDAGNGRLIPSTSIQQFAAPMGRWFGLNDTEISQSLPGLSEFNSNSIPLFKS